MWVTPGQSSPEDLWFMGSPLCHGLPACSWSMASLPYFLTCQPGIAGCCENSSGVTLWSLFQTWWQSLGRPQAAWPCQTCETR